MNHDLFMACFTAICRFLLHLVNFANFAKFREIEKVRNLHMPSGELAKNDGNFMLAKY